ncbi:hypothetical protein MKX03_017243 [Papaver bracteatum]|nr:hypothetical protein MKX03_017243 [Papaver bracteatum]
MKILTHQLSLILIISCMSMLAMDVQCLVAVEDNKSNDRLVLLAFKDGITQDPLGVLNTWNNDNNSLHFCRWKGVTCSLRHPNRVTVLDLDSQGLVGSISSHIGNLSFLKDLYLGNNSLNGEIPQQIGRLYRLKHLSLSHNLLMGEIPENISRCSNLIHLNITNNKLVGRIPDALGSLSNLKMMWLANNNLSGEIPTSLGNLSSLNVISLDYNNLEGRVPSTLSQLTSLEALDLNSNRFSGTVPPSLYNISSLQIFSRLGFRKPPPTFSAMGNQLHGNIPFNIGFTLPNLIFFAVSGNNFTGTVPASFSNLSRLGVLQLQVNNLVGSVPYNLGDIESLTALLLGGNNLGYRQANDLNFLSSLINCTNLRLLIAGNNNFGGMLPSSLGNLTTNLNTLVLEKNHIYGSVPTSIMNLVGLTNLYLDENLLTGSIPPGIGSLRNLGRLNFRKNKFSGSIPSSFGNLSRLNYLVLDNNHLTGLIPSSLGNCKSLAMLDLHKNKLSGSIPKQVFELPALSYVLNLGNNLFTGSLPMEVGNLEALEGLDLSGNKLSGEIPSTIGECLSLTDLYLDGNFFQGNIPAAITFLKGLENLSLSHNNLSGVIPKGLENLTTLIELDLSYNNLEGEVPKEGVFKNSSDLSIEGNIKLCGGIPDLKLQNCSMPLNPDTKRSKTKSMSVEVIAVIIVLVILFPTLLVLLVTLYWRKKSKLKLNSTALDVGNQHMGISYNELLKATNGFNKSTNLLGVGSFGYVYKGVLLEHESKHVAVKVLHLQKKGANKSFMDECDALRKVRHRNLLKIVTCCSSIDFQGNPFKALVFEFMVNGNLENWLHPIEFHATNKHQQHVKNLNLERRLSIAVDVASALNYLHHYCQPPIAHCDLKPSNVLLDDDLIAHVGDFGLAKFLSNPSSSSRKLNEQDASSIAIKGSIGYVSPEYGIGGKVSTQGDVYSYGILLLEMFTGKRPTDDMFLDGLNIHNFCKMYVSPEHVEEIIDSRLLLDVEGEYYNSDARDTIRQILATTIKIGVKCSSELPSDRCSMSEVTAELEAVKNWFLDVVM